MGRTLRILVVDDQRRARKSLKALLATRFQGLEFLEAGDGLEAVRLAEERQPHVVLMDARLPVLGGIEATRRLKAKTPQLPVIMLSMYPEFQAEAMAAGAEVFLSKGDPPEILLAAIAAAAGLGE